MDIIETFSRAPITEALFEIQVELPQEVTILDLEQLCNDIKNEYPKKLTRKRFEGRIEVKVDQVPTSESIDLGVDGFFNWSSDEKQVVQFRLDGFSFSRLKPYKCWDEYFPEVIKHWNIYSKKLSPIRIKRIAIRFINTIEIPLKEFKLQDYFVSFPLIPIETSVLNNFFNRIELSLPEMNVNAVITQTLPLSNNPIITPIIFDIEVSKEINSQVNEKTISDVFQMLRKIKNDIFTKSLKQKTKELFK